MLRGHAGLRAGAGRSEGPTDVTRIRDRQTAPPSPPSTPDLSSEPGAKPNGYWSPCVLGDLLCSRGNQRSVLPGIPVVSLLHGRLGPPDFSLAPGGCPHKVQTEQPKQQNSLVS